MQEVGSSLTGLKRDMAVWAKKKGLRGNQNIQKGCIRSYIHTY